MNHKHKAPAATLTALLAVACSDPASKVRLERLEDQAFENGVLVLALGKLLEGTNQDSMPATFEATEKLRHVSAEEWKRLLEKYKGFSAEQRERIHKKFQADLPKIEDENPTYAIIIRAMLTELRNVPEQSATPRGR